MNIASSFRLVATILWVGSFGFLIFAMLRSSQNKPIRRSGLTIVVAFLISVFFSLISMGMVFIEPQERAVVISAVSPKGYREQALQPGLQWIIPGLENVKRYPISKQSYTMSVAPSEGEYVGDDSITARTSDGQQIFVEASVIYSINPTSIIKVHIEWQDRYSDGLVRPVTRSVIRDAVSQFGVEEVYSSKREELTLMISQNMTEKLEQNGLIMDQFLLRNITFSEEYAASVEQKQIAEQLAQQAIFVVEQKKQEAEQARQTAEGVADASVIRSKGEAEARLIQAEAEAKSLLLIAEAVRDRPDLLTYQYITKLAPNIQTMLLPANSPFLFPLPEMNESGSQLPTTIIPETQPIP
ncbi:MAG: prohibitin family protein [Anaerolineaceae bacterium]|jgi:regulator of protease activity HflC (stomatin/prohibitin superfamily)|nr:prohibitin family protein [Anaerolineaceae bacterium]